MAIDLQYDSIFPDDPTAAGVRIPVLDAGGQAYDVRTFGNAGIGSEVQAAIDAAINSAVHVVNVPARDYALSSRLTISSPVRVNFAPGARLVVAAGFDDDHAVQITSGYVTLDGLVLDGAELPVTAETWIGVGEPRGVGIRVVGSGGAELEKIRIINSEISNTPFSGISASHVRDLTIDSQCRIENCSTNTAAEAPAAVSIVNGYGVSIDELIIIDPGMKGFSASNCQSVHVSRSRSEGGNTGHAHWFVVNSDDISLSQVHAEGPGFGFKCDRFRNFFAFGITSDGCEGGLYLQGGIGAEVLASTMTDPGDWGFLIDSHPTYSESISDVRLMGCTVKRTTAGPFTSGQRAFGVQTRAGLSTTDVSIVNYTVDGAYYGVICLKDTVDFGTLAFTNGTFRNITVSAVVARGDNLTIDGVEVYGGCSNSVVQVSGSDAGTECRVRNVRAHAPDAVTLSFTSVAVYERVIVEGVKALGGTIGINWNNAVADKLAVRNCVLLGSSTTQLNIATSTALEVEFLNNDMTGKRFTFSDPTVITGVERDNVHSSLFSNRPAKLKPYRATAQPSSGSWTARDFVENNAPSVQGTAGSRYVIAGWRRLTTGSGHTAGTDWVEARELTGT